MSRHGTTRRALVAACLTASSLFVLPGSASAATHRAPVDVLANSAVESAKAGTVAVYVKAVTDAEIAAYVAAVHQQQVDAAARAYASSINSRRLTPARSSAPMTGGTYRAPHSDAWWHGVAQCEQGGRNDPYFGYFSFMNGSQGGKPWADQVAAANQLITHVRNESPAWAPSCVAAGYRASPSG